jgi:hypothetical protein
VSWKKFTRAPDAGKPACGEVREPETRDTLLTLSRA